MKDSAARNVFPYATMTVPGRVTVGIPTMNRSNLALRAIQSALEQTFRDVEVIVSDDASTDDTVSAFAQSPTRASCCSSKSSDSAWSATSIFACATPPENSSFCSAMTMFFSPPPSNAFGNLFSTRPPPSLPHPSALSGLLVALQTPTTRNSGLPRPVLLRNPPLRCWSLCSPAIAGRGSAASCCEPRMRSPSAGMNQSMATCSTSATGDGRLCSATLPSAFRSRWCNIPSITAAQPVVRRAAMAAVGANRPRRPARQRPRPLRSSGRAALRSAKTNFISGITLTILIQTIGKPHWIQNAVAQSLRTSRGCFHAVHVSQTHEGWLESFGGSTQFQTSKIIIATPITCSALSQQFHRVAASSHLRHIQ